MRPPYIIRRRSTSQRVACNGLAAHEKLVKIVAQPMLVKDLQQLTEQIHTTLLEVFHTLKIRYLPKATYFRMEKMIGGTQLAILDHNNNVDRAQKCTTDEEGEKIPPCRVAYSKPNKRFVAKVVREEKNYEYLTYIVRKILKRTQLKRKATSESRLKRQCSLQIAPEERPPKEKIVEKSQQFKRIKL
ncbi:uncharacterized protein LOC130622919 [Hydractinia symbiolongicarpus]|uniref:uncharacterized protein LOC130622919 n=1 Tax=Hydractinia symbiolongicarpus TaxID=13093 RepID=UPI00255189C8|nr:uncharacterized protein LOC130622919 [Hydractinia symbiolongicarpus]